MIKTVMQPVKPHRKLLLVKDMEGDTLNWAVAKAIGKPIYPTKRGEWMEKPYGEFNHRQGIPYWSPTTRWEQAGPIIEREGIELLCESLGFRWVAMPQKGPEWRGPTPLIAAMRCLVASRLGDEIEIPEGLG